MSDKRRYQRERVDVPVNIYIIGGMPGKVEFSGVLVNISEVGILIEVRDERSIEVARTAKVGGEIRFVGIDEYELFEEQRTEYLDCIAKVVWTNEKGGVYSMGGEIENLPRKLEKYISDRKVIGFQNRGCVL